MTKLHNRNKAILILFLLMILFGTTALVIVVRQHKQDAHGSSAEVKKMYVCSMEPQIIRDKPGYCPICGMALIEKKDFDQNYADPRLNKVVRPVNETILASVPTTSPVRAELPLVIEASGIVNYDLRNITTISARFRGLVEHSYIKYTFQPIHKGQKIYDIYCPEIYSTHMNYINLIRKYPDQPEINRDARNWLVQIGLTDEQIRDLITSDKLNFHLSVYSSVDGFAVSNNFNPEQFQISPEESAERGIFLTTENRSIGLNEGVIIEEGTPLFKVIGTETVRVDLKVRNEDAGLLKSGLKLTLIDVSSPGKKMNATVSQVEPLNGGLFQLVKVFLSDPQRMLLPGMKIQAYIEAGRHNSLWVARSAVADLGLNKAVFLLQDSTFVVTAVTTGLRSGDKIEIRAGIDENSVIAINALLLTDSDGIIKPAYDESR